jgi:hypothetical protein
VLCCAVLTTNQIIHQLLIAQALSCQCQYYDLLCSALLYLHVNC